MCHRARAVATLLLASLLFATAPAGAETYHVSPQGSDDDSGHESAPWRTLAHSLTRLRAGDTLLLHDGTYHEHELIATLRGTAESPIVMASRTGQRAVIDGAIPDFQQPGNNAWELVDHEKQVYRSVKAYSLELPTAWLVDERIQIIRYRTLERLTSDVCDTGGYIGPGVAVHEGRLYIRLTTCPHDLVDWRGDPIAPIPADPDPRKSRIAVADARFLLRLDGCSHVRLANIDFVHATNEIPWPKRENGVHECGFHPQIRSVGNVELTGGTEHVTFDDCRFDYLMTGMTVRDASHVTVRDCEFHAGMPDWLVWYDVKGSQKSVYPDFNNFGLAGVTRNVLLEGNVFAGSMDGIILLSGSENTRVLNNTFRGLRDDAINVCSYVDNIEVAGNLIRGCYEGISVVGYPYTKGKSGPAYFHHNVIDVVAYHRRFRAPGSDWTKVWECGKAWGSHSCNNRVGGNCENNNPEWGVGGDCSGDWYVYNNTMITRRRFKDRRGTGNFVPRNARAYVNNVIVETGDATYSSRRSAGGNVFWRTDGKSGRIKEPAALTVDPGFDLAAIESNAIPAESEWAIYLPSNPAIFMKGVTYEARWPGIAGVNYRGAVPPDAEILQSGRE